MKRSRLRSYAPLAKQSEKIKDAEAEYRAVYVIVDKRSEGRCEVTEDIGMALGRRRCHRRGVEHHHLYKPRRSHHTASEVIHVCRADHDRMEYPYPRGRLCFVGRMGSAFLFAIRYTSDKPFRDAGALRGSV